MGTLIAWVLVRDELPGRRLVELVIDIPFALPTIVAGLVLLALYGTDSPVGIDLLGTQRAVVFALLFVTLPFVVRTVQPVLMTLEQDVEEAAASLGAGAVRPSSGGSCCRRIAAGHRLRDRAGVRPGDGRVRLGAADLRRRVQGPGVLDVRLPARSRISTTGARPRRRPCCWSSALLVMALLDLIKRRVARRG